MWPFKKKDKNRKSSDSASIRIYIEHSGNILYELNSNDYSKEIIIGRSPQAPWTLDGIDSSASSQHAVLSKRKNHFYITDLESRNGIFFQNKRIKEKKLSIGDRITLGECTVTVEEPHKNAKRQTHLNRIEYTNEKGRKTIVDIVKPQMSIGSGKDCDIIFLDQLVSSHHAELLLRNDGSCWIRDLGSRNGTSVNGAELVADGERMLKDEDIITIAYMDLRFLDAAIEHHESKLWTSIATIAITALVVLGLYIGYMTLVLPPSEELLKWAIREMDAGNFEKAKELIDQSKDARNSALTRDERERLTKRLSDWERVIKLWLSSHNDMKNGQYNTALQKLSTIKNDNINMWTWRAYAPDGRLMTGATEREKADDVIRLLSAGSAADAKLKNTSTTIENIENSRAELISAINFATRNKDDFFTRPVESAQRLLAKTEKTLEENIELKATLAILDNRNPDYQAVIRRLEKLRRESTGPVKSRADKVLPPVTQLNNETIRLREAVDKVKEMRFGEVNSFELNLPETIDYATEKNIGSLRKKLIETAATLKDTSLQLANIYNNLIKKDVAPGKPLPPIDDFLDKKTMDALYSFDILEMPLPRISRQTPSGKYDEMLGMELFYDYVSNIPMTTLSIEDMPFRPKIFEAKEITREIEKFVAFADNDTSQWFNDGEFKEFLEHCRSIIKKRDSIIKAQLARNYPKGSREHIVSRGIAAYLSSGDIAPLEQEIADSFSVYKQNVLKLNKEYSLSMPTEQMTIRGKIIKTGLPGNPILKTMWQQRPAEGWSKTEK